jgi:hypothetical protein
VHYAFGCEFEELAQGSHAAPAGLRTNLGWVHQAA